MESGILALLLISFGLAVFAFHIWAIVDVVRTPTPVWDASEQNQIMWVLIVLLLSVAGPILYVVIARPRLLAARTPA